MLANAGVDAFEEVFKLIYAKLYDECNAARAKTAALDIPDAGLHSRQRQSSLLIQRRRGL